MKIYNPIKNSVITQRFLENRACIQLGADGKAIQPYRTITKIGDTCPVGWIGLYEYLGAPGHLGIDFYAPEGTPIKFNADPELDTKWEMIKIYSNEGGIGVLVRSTSPISLDKAPSMPGAKLNLVQGQYNSHGGAVHLMAYFGHMKSTTIESDREEVMPGDIIGYVGQTGAASGPHCHHHWLVCGTNEQNPFFYLDGDSDWSGRVDIEAEGWYNDKYIDDARADILRNKIVELQKQVIVLLNKLIEKLWASKKG